ncbi:hypothetical protein BKA62DRAFT_674964 [Auriculariales sp. MPI-PUGE-AT-0066]|nr:hypothetical protein BKA62DRAFT_674964 [Auriculariales sp. MPI-PUGE-AT-0066]
MPLLSWWILEAPIARAELASLQHPSGFDGARREAGNGEAWSRLQQTVRKKLPAPFSLPDPGAGSQTEKFLGSGWNRPSAVSWRASLFRVQLRGMGCALLNLAPRALVSQALPKPAPESRK